MSTISTALAAVTARQAQTQATLSTEIVKQQIEAQAAILKVIEATTEAAQTIEAASPASARRVDISV